MRVFVLGGTGSIGSPIVRELRKRGHEVWALARSGVSAAKLRDRVKELKTKAPPRKARKPSRVRRTNPDHLRFLAQFHRESTVAASGAGQRL